MNISNISSLFEKKNFVLNCSICDARKVKEEDLARYEHIIINSDVLLVNEESKSVLARLRWCSTQTAPWMWKET